MMITVKMHKTLWAVPGTAPLGRSYGNGFCTGCSALKNLTCAEGVVIGEWAVSRTPCAEMNP